MTMGEESALLVLFFPLILCSAYTKLKDFDYNAMG